MAIIFTKNTLLNRLPKALFGITSNRVMSKGEVCLLDVNICK